MNNLPIRERWGQKRETQRQTGGNWEKRSEKNSYRNKGNMTEKAIT